MKRSRDEQEAINRVDTVLRLYGLPTWTELTEESMNILKKASLWNSPHTNHKDGEEARYCIYCKWREVIRRAMGEKP